MANPQWGTKRVCQNCSTKFYDLQHDPIICPKCRTVFDPEAFLKTRRPRGAAAAEKEPAPAAAAAPGIEDLEIGDPAVLDDEAGAGEGSDEEDDDLIEDASELGEDEDDMAEVIENVDEEEER